MHAPCAASSPSASVYRPRQEELQCPEDQGESAWRRRSKGRGNLVEARRREGARPAKQEGCEKVRKVNGEKQMENNAEGGSTNDREIEEGEEGAHEESKREIFYYC
eukprot:3422036-Pleurochrysis_carterae.AAC.4